MPGVAIAASLVPPIASSGLAVSIGDYDLAFQSDLAATASTIPSPEPRSQPPPRLVVLGEPAAGAEFTLGKPQLRIGRDERLEETDQLEARLVVEPDELAA